MSRTYTRLEVDEINPSAELSELTRSATGDGAVVSFVGLARPTTKTDDPLKTLVLEPHPSLTEKSLDDIAKDALQRFAVSRVHVIHRAGRVTAGQTVVFAGAASAHRRAAFEAADYLMDRLKTEAVFWKREESLSGSVWIEPSDADYADRGRWD